MGNYFGTDGFRGEVNVTLTAAHAYRLGRFLGWYATQKCPASARIVIGKDTRRSGYMLEYALTAGITASGADAYLLHVTTTPSVSYVARTEGFHAAAMISASHNPYYDNGIKLIGTDGEKANGEVIDLAEQYLDGCITYHGIAYPELPYATRGGIGRTVDYTAGRDHYTDFLISAAYCPLSRMRIGLDTANGSAWQIARTVFEALGASVVVIGDTPNGENINSGVGSTHIDALTKLVKAHALDVGFAFDGDADRCIAVDERGQVVDGDGILFLAAKHMKKEGMLPEDSVVGTVMTNSGTERSLSDAGISLIRTPVGDAHVWREMKARGICLGGESSGHIIFSRYASTGDGILTSLRVLEVMLAEHKRLSELVAGISRFPQTLRNISVKSPKEAAASIYLRDAVCEAEKRLGGRGRVLVRASGTEPLLRIMCESEDPNLCTQICDMLEACVKEDAGSEVTP